MFDYIICAHFSQKNQNLKNEQIAGKYLCKGYKNGHGKLVVVSCIL